MTVYTTVSVSRQITHSSIMYTVDLVSEIVIQENDEKTSGVNDNDSNSDGEVFEPDNEDDFEMADGDEINWLNESLRATDNIGSTQKKAISVDEIFLNNEMTTSYDSRSSNIIYNSQGRNLMMPQNSLPSITQSTANSYSQHTDVIDMTDTPSCNNVSTTTSNSYSRGELSRPTTINKPSTVHSANYGNANRFVNTSTGYSNICHSHLHNNSQESSINSRNHTQSYTPISAGNGNDNQRRHTNSATSNSVSTTNRNSYDNVIDLEEYDNNTETGYDNNEVEWISPLNMDQIKERSTQNMSNLHEKEQQCDNVNTSTSVLPLQNNNFNIFDSHSNESSSAMLAKALLNVFKSSSM
jgi:hypothetical protein